MRKTLLVVLTCLGSLLVTPLAAQETSVNNRLLRLMKEYTEAPAPSGYEEPVRELFVRDLRELGAEISLDGLGSVIALVPGSSERPRIMVDAHMDEIGLMVQQIRPDGYISFQTLGGIMDQALLDQRWVIVTQRGPVPAVTGIPDVHIWPEEKRDKVLARGDICLDVGSNSRAQVEALGIRPGDPVAPEAQFTVLANNRLAAKAWDDRIGLLVMLEAVRRLKEKGIKTPNAIYLVGTAQEEVGLRGAHTAVEKVKPDLGIGIEVGIAGDVPSTSVGGTSFAGPEVVQERLGQGPAMFLYDATMLPNLKLRDLVLRVAADENIPLQTEVLAGNYGQDGQEIQLYGGGRPVVNLTVPTRYTHAHTGVIDGTDFDHTVALLMEILKRLDARTVRDISHFQQGGQVVEQ